MKRPVQFLVAACVLAAASACTTDDPTANTSIPLIPTQAIVDTFAGSVAVAGKDEKVFSVTEGNGGLDITLTSLSQPLVVGIGAGTWDGTSCTLGANSTRNVTPGTSPQLSFTQVPVGNYCVRVFDPNTPSTWTAPVSYNLKVAHY
jgi:hypothetical protein